MVFSEDEGMLRQTGIAKTLFDPAYGSGDS